MMFGGFFFIVIIAAIVYFSVLRHGGHGLWHYGHRNHHHDGHHHGHSHSDNYHHSHYSSYRDNDSHSSDDLITILQQRYAKGEIDRETYQRMLKELKR